MFNRPTYLNKLISFKDHELIKVITGIRRCGKSSLLMLFAEYLESVGINKDNILRINFEDLEYGQTVYVKETKAPKGYQLSDEVVKIVIDDQLEGIGKVHSFQYENEKIPVVVVKTGDATHMFYYLILAGGCLIFIIKLCRTQKETDR